MCQSKQLSCRAGFETVCAHNPYVARKTLRTVFDWVLKNKKLLASLGTFQKIYNHIHKRWGKGNKEGVVGIGRLTKYDLSMIICNEFEISLNGRVYLMGRGPRRAAVLLWIWSSGWGKKKKCKETGEFYIMVDDVREAFEKSKYLYDKKTVENGTADDLESYMCNWQKRIKLTQAI